MGCSRFMFGLCVQCCKIVDLFLSGCSEVCSGDTDAKHLRLDIGRKWVSEQSGSTTRLDNGEGQYLAAKKAL